MAGQLYCRAVLGVKGDVHNNVLPVEEDVIVFPAGAYIVRYNGRTKSHENMVPLTGSGLPAAAVAGTQSVPLVGSPAGAIAMALAPTRRSFVVAERSSSPDERITISFYQSRTMVKKKCIVVGRDLGAGGQGHGGAAGEVLAMMFSPDEAILAVLGGGPEYVLALYSTEKCKLLTRLVLSTALGVQAVARGDSAWPMSRVGHLLDNAAAAVGVTDAVHEAAAASYAASLPQSDGASASSAARESTASHSMEGTLAATHGGQGSGAGKAEKAASLHMTIAGAAFSTQSSSRILVWGQGVLALLALEQGGQEDSAAQTTLRVLPTHPSIEALANHAAFNAQAQAQHYADAAAEQVAQSLDLGALRQEAEDAVALAAETQAAAEAATAAVSEGGNPAEDPGWVQKTQAAGEARIAADAAAAAYETAAAQVQAAADAATATALVSLLDTSLQFAAAAWLPGHVRGSSEEATGELAIVGTALGELVVMNSDGHVLGHVDTSSAAQGEPLQATGIQQQKNLVAVVAHQAGQAGLGGFVTANEVGSVTVYERVAVSGSAGSKGGRKGAVGGSGARAASASSKMSRGSSRGLPEPELPALAHDHGLHWSFIKTFACTAPGLETEVPVTTLAMTASGNKAVFALAGSQFLTLDVLNAALKDDSSAVQFLGPPSHSSATLDAIAVGTPVSPVSGKSRSAALSKTVPVGTLPSAIPGMSAVVSMDVAVRKPVLATIGCDGALRLWNWVEKSCELIRTFNEAPGAVALHPSGLSLALAFHDRVRLYDILADELKEVRDWPARGVSEMRFSRGGHLLAAATTAGFVIQVYDTLTGMLAQTLRGHNGRVSTLQWAYNDCTLLSTGADGAVYDWSVMDGKRSREALFKGFKCTGASATKDGSVVYAVGELAPSSGPGLTTRQSSAFTQASAKPSYALRSIDMSTGLVREEMPLPERPAGIAMSFSKPMLLFVGAAGVTGDGTPGVVRSLHADPLETAEEAEEQAAVKQVAALAKHNKDEGDVASTTSAAAASTVQYSYGAPSLIGMPACSIVPATSAGVTKLMLSSDDCTLFVAGQDGSIVIYDVRDSEGRLPLSEFATKMPWADEVQLTLSELLEKRGQIKELKDKLAELQASVEYADRMHDVDFGETVKKVAERSGAELEGERSHYELLVEEKADVEREYQDRLNGMDLAHRAEMQKREAMYQTKIMAEIERYQALSREVESARGHWNHARQVSASQHTALVARLTNDYETRLAAVREKRSVLSEEAASARKDWGEMRGQMEGDLDGEVEGLKAAYQAKLDAERDSALKYKGENGIMRKKFASLGKEIEENKESISATLARHAGLRGTLESLERDIAGLRGVIHEKDGVIGERERRIYELKKKNQELEKFKFVLDVKIKELKGQIEPREAEIAALKKQVREVNAELEAYHKSNSALDGTIGQLRADVDGMTSRAVNGRIYTKTKESLLATFKAELYRLVQIAKTPEDFHAYLNSLIARFVPTDMSPPSADLAVVAESERQREMLEGQLKTLKQESEAAAVKASKELAALVNENMTLIESTRSLKEEIALLRAEARTIRLDMSEAAAHKSMSRLASASSPSLAASLGGQQDRTTAKPPVGSKTVTLPPTVPGNRR